MLDRSGELVLANAEGHVIKARTVKRLVVSSRWDKEMLDNIKGSPWAPVDGERVEGIPVEVHFPPVIDVPVVPETWNPQVQRMKFRKEVYMEYGHPDCRGCGALRRGGAPRPHSKECIERVMKAVGDLPEWQERLKRDEERVNWKIAENIEQQGKRARVGGSAAGGPPGQAASGSSGAARVEGAFGVDGAGASSVPAAGADGAGASNVPAAGADGAGASHGSAAAPGSVA